MIRELDAQIDALDAAIAALEKQEPEETGQLRLRQLRRDREELLALCRVRTPEDRVWLAVIPAVPPCRIISRRCLRTFLRSRETTTLGRIAVSWEGSLCSTARRSR